MFSQLCRITLRSISISHQSLHSACPAMALSTPSWALASGTSSGRGGNGGEQTPASSAKGLVAKVAEELKQKGKLDLENLLSALLKLSLMTAENTRDIMGAIFLTFAIPTDGKLCKKLVEIGQCYHNEAVGKRPEEHNLGPPYVHLWAAIIQICYEETKDEEMKRDLKLYWETVIISKTKEELADVVQFTRLRKEGKKGKGGGKKGRAKAKAKAKGEPQPPAAKSQKRDSKGSPLTGEAEEDEDEYMSADEQPTGMRILQFRVEDKDVSHMIVKVLKELNCVKKRGAAPRSALERVCQQFLSEMTGKNKINKK